MRESVLGSNQGLTPTCIKLGSAIVLEMEIKGEIESGIEFAACGI
jgi:hypothetical protein